MKPLEERFKIIVSENPSWSSYTCFVKTVRGNNFSRKEIEKMFNKLVDKDDYDKSEKQEIINSLVELSRG